MLNLFLILTALFSFMPLSIFSDVLLGISIFIFIFDFLGSIYREKIYLSKPTITLAILIVSFFLQNPYINILSVFFISIIWKNNFRYIKNSNFNNNFIVYIFVILIIIFDRNSLIANSDIFTLRLLQENPCTEKMEEYLLKENESWSIYSENGKIFKASKKIYGTLFLHKIIRYESRSNSKGILFNQINEDARLYEIKSCQ